jgi:hypothetical protein
MRPVPECQVSYDDDRDLVIAARWFSGYVPHEMPHPQRFDRPSAVFQSCSLVLYLAGPARRVKNFALLDF